MAYEIAIIQHTRSGERYAVLIGSSDEGIAKACGPLTSREIIEVLVAEDFDDDLKLREELIAAPDGEYVNANVTLSESDAAQELVEERREQAAEWLWSRPTL